MFLLVSGIPFGETVLRVVWNSQPLSRVNTFQRLCSPQIRDLPWGVVFGTHSSQMPFFPVTWSSGYLFPDPNLDLHPILSQAVVRWKLASECLWEHFLKNMLVQTSTTFQILTW